MTKRKFINKNRQKRKYTRRSVSSPTLPVTKTLFVGIVPSIILAFALVTVVLVLQQYRDQAIVLSVPELHVPTLSFDLTKLTTSIASFTNAITSTLQQMSISMSNLYEQIGLGLQYFVQLFQQAGVLIMHGLIRVADLFLQSMTVVGTHIAQGSITVSTAASEYALRAWMIIASSAIIGFTVLSTLIMAILHGLGMLADWVVSVVRMPFDAMGVLWQHIKPYADILGAHIQMVGQDFSAGVDNLNKLSAAANSSK